MAKTKVEEIETKSKWQKAISIICTILVFLMLCSIALFTYFKTIGKKFVPNAITSTYVSTVTDPRTGEKLPFMEANYYEFKNKPNNENSNLEYYFKNGFEVLELKINSYSGTERQAIYSRGYQLVVLPLVLGKETYILYKYDSANGVSFLSGHEYDIKAVDDSMYITEIDDVMYGVALDGTYTKNEFNFGKSVGWFFSGFVKGWGNKEERTTSKFKYNYTMGDFLNYLRLMIKSSSNGTGDSTIPLADLGSYLSVYGEKNGQFNLPLSFNTLNNAYFTIKTHYDRRPMKSYRQSMFKSVMGDSSFNLTGVTSETDYSKDTTTMIIDETYFTKRIVDGKSYASLDLNFVRDYLETEKIELEVVFNANEFNGLDHYALCGLKINSFKISSTKLKDFEILNGALQDTGLKIEDLKLSNINLIDKGV